MKRLIIFLIILIASVWLGLLAIQHPGFLLIVYQPWMIQMPLWFAVLCFLIFISLFYFLVDSFDRIGFLWFRLKNWLHIRREHQSYSKTQQGLALLIEGRYKKAEKFLLAGVNQSIDPLINYLSAARAAHHLGAYDRRDRYIQKAYEVAPRATIAIGLTQSELEFNQHQFEQTIATLTHLREISPYHPRVLQLLEKVYVHLGEWKHLQALLPAMKKAKILSKEEYLLFEKNLYCENFRNSHDRRLSDLRALWNDVPRSIKKNPDVVTAYVTQLLPHVPITGAETSREIEALIRKTLKTGWYPELATIYGKLPFSDINHQLVVVGAWVKMYGQQPELLLILGKLCARQKLWGKAREYFTRCLAQGPNPECSLEYGKLLESLDEMDEAREKYKQALLEITS